MIHIYEYSSDSLLVNDKSVTPADEPVCYAEDKAALVCVAFPVHPVQCELHCGCSLMTVDLMKEME